MPGDRITLCGMEVLAQKAGEEGGLWNTAGRESTVTMATHQWPVHTPLLLVLYRALGEVEMDSPQDLTLTPIRTRGGGGGGQKK